MPKKETIIITLLLMLGITGWSAYFLEHRISEGKLYHLRLDYEDLMIKYERLKTSLKQGEIVAGSSRCYSWDHRLEVESKVIPRLVHENVVDYNIKVTVRNISGEYLSEVWIFIFPYVNGSLYFHPSYHMIKLDGLYPGESDTYIFIDLPRDMTSYEILVIGGT